LNTNSAATSIDGAAKGSGPKMTKASGADIRSLAKLLADAFNADVSDRLYNK
jgi:hypothetical protein